MPHNLFLEVKSPSQEFSQIACLAELIDAEVLATDLTVSAATSARNATDLATKGRESLTSFTGVSEESKPASEPKHSGP